ncbi:MAG TPA: hypothetical protein VHZ74_08480 [Bryobacteraceae bacterium]|nr:hypothetical protein [Bryobacteraceae bacterium]
MPAKILPGTISPGKISGGLAVILTAATAFASSPSIARHEKARALILDACTACHTLERVERQRLNEDQWHGVIAGMLSEGVPLTDEETTLVVEYLAANFGPETP